MIKITMGYSLIYGTKFNEDTLVSLYTYAPIINASSLPGRLSTYCGAQGQTRAIMALGTNK